MPDVGVPKEQKTAYERWEMASFGDSDFSIGVDKPKKKSSLEQTDEIAQIFETARQEAYQKGMQEGYAVGMAKARESAIEDKNQFLQLMGAFSHALEMTDEQVADDVLSLALDVAKAMLKAKIEVDKSAILPVVMDAIHYLPHVQKPARILVHHDDAQILREYLADEISSQHWTIQEDGNIERGGCLVETGANQIDASNETRWKRISDALAQHNSWLIP